MTGGGRQKDCTALQKEALVKKIVMLVFTAVVIACATPDGMRRVTTNDKVVYDLPVEGVQQGDFAGVSFDVRPYECVRSGFKYRRDTKLGRQGDDSCTVDFMTSIVAADGSRTSPQIAYDRYQFKVKKSSEKGFTRLTFKPLYEGIHPYRNFGSAGISPPHSIESAMEVLATSGKLVYRFELGTPLTPSAVTKNLRKYLKPASHVRQPVTIMGKKFTSSYLLMTGDNTLATFYISLQRLAKGTKVEAIAALRLSPDDNYHVDAVGQARDVKRVLADAVTPDPRDTAARR